MSGVGSSSSDTFGRFFWELREGSRRQANVIFALMFKEFKNRTGRNSRLGMLWIVLDPQLQVLIMSTAWYLAGRTEISGVPVVMFLAMALAPFNTVMLGLGPIARAIPANRSFYNYQQVKPIDAILAQFILDMVLEVIGIALLFGVLWWLYGMSFDLNNIAPLLGIFAIAMATCLGLALLLGTYGTIYDNVSKFVSIATRPLLFFSSVFYTPNDMPAAARYWLSWNPITQLIEYARFYALDIPLFPEADFSVPMVFMVGTLFFGLLSYYVFRHELTR